MAFEIGSSRIIPCFRDFTLVVLRGLKQEPLSFSSQEAHRDMGLSCCSLLWCDALSWGFYRVGGQWVIIDRTKKLISDVFSSALDSPSQYWEHLMGRPLLYWTWPHRSRKVYWFVCGTFHTFQTGFTRPWASSALVVIFSHSTTLIFTVFSLLTLAFYSLCVLDRDADGSSFSDHHLFVRCLLCEAKADSCEGVYDVSWTSSG